MIGTTLLQRYRIDTLLGQGGMGTVYCAYDLHLERNVAIKVLSSDELGSQGRTRLLQEARSAAKLNHPNIVSVYDAQRDAGVSFVVMELVNGKTLRDQQPASMEEVIAIARQICSALEHAHNHGVIHRDLKPENVMVARLENEAGVNVRVKLMDFGLARSVRDERLQDGGLIGTPAYISPEQIKEHEPDTRSDLYSLGVMLYEIVTGELPFKTVSLLSLISHHLNALPTPPRQVNPSIPPHLETIILRLLAKDPTDRYQSASAVLQELLSAFPPAGQAPATAARHNLPAETTTFVGRQKEAADVLTLAQQARLVTLTGSGGIGKTRLSLHVAFRLLDVFPDGVWLTELAQLTDPEMVPQAVARVFGVQTEPGRPIIEKLCAYAAERSLLLILDNCEHLMDACATLTEQLLRAAPRLKILASSREALGIAGEVTYRVPSLSLPGGQHQEQSEAVRLFVERAKAASPGFALGPENLDAIAQICRRLDGIPLALELAAARVNMLKVEQIATRLDDRFRLLTGGSRTALPRQQTLRALIDWSWELLSHPERALLRGVSVFAGGWSLESAEAICANLRVDETHVIHPDDIFDLLGQLAQKSLALVEQDDLGEMRYRLLETIRQYAREKLWDAKDSQAEQLRNRHLAHFHKLAAQAAGEMRSHKQAYWHQRQVLEMDNFRAALEWSLQRDVAAGLVIASSLERYWQTHAVAQGLNWLQSLLAQPEKESETPARARGWLALASLQRWTGDMGTAALYVPKSLALFRQLRDLRGESECLSLVAFTVYHLGQVNEAVEAARQALEISRANQDKYGQQLALAMLGGRVGDRDYPRARAFLEESLAICRSLGIPSETSERLDDLAVLAFRSGDYEQAHTWLSEAIEIAREGRMPNLGWLYRTMGELEQKRGNLSSAREYLEISIQMNRDQGAVIHLQWGIAHLAYTLKNLGELSLARDRFVEGLRLFEQAGHARIGIVFMAEGLASLLTIYGRYTDALTLYTWADTERLALGDQRPLVEQADVDRDLQEIRLGLGQPEANASESLGKQLTQAQALALAHQSAAQL